MKSMLDEMVQDIINERNSVQGLAEYMGIPDKLFNLEQARQDKLNRLSQKQGASLDNNSYSISPESFKESNANKIWNDYDANDIQQLLGDISAKYQLHQDETTGRYYTPDGKIYKGDVRRIYMYGTKDDPDSVKLGLARGDLPTSDARYVPDMVPGYGWDPGEKGVDIKKKYMDMLLPYDVATKLEALIHGRTEALQNRKYKDVLGKTVPGINSGVSEYYTSATGMLGDSRLDKTPAKNLDINEIGKDLPNLTPKATVWKTVNGTDLLKPSDDLIKEWWDKDVNEIPKAYQPYMRFIKGELYNNVGDEFEQTVKGVGSGILKGAVELGDAAYSFGRWATGNILPDSTKAKKSTIDAIDELIGYDRSKDEASLERIAELARLAGVDVTDPSSYSKLMGTYGKEILKEIATNPSLTASMISEIGGSGGALKVGAWALGKLAARVMPKVATTINNAFTTNASKINNEIKAVKANTALSDEAKAIEIANLKNQYTASKKAVDFIRGTTTSNADFAVRLNNDIEAYKQNNDGEGPGLLELVRAAALDRIASNLEVMSIKSIFKPGTTTLSEEAEKAIKKSYSKIAKELSSAIGKEAAQETLDSLIETINQKYGTAQYKGKSLAEVIKDSSSDIITGMAGGAAGGLHAGGIRAGYDVAKNKISNILNDNTLNAIGMTESKAPLDTQISTSWQQRQQRFNNIGTEGYTVGRSEQLNKLREAAAPLEAELSTLQSKENHTPEEITRIKELKNELDPIYNDINTLQYEHDKAINAHTYDIGAYVVDVWSNPEVPDNKVLDVIENAADKLAKLHNIDLSTDTDNKLRDTLKAVVVENAVRHMQSPTSKSSKTTKASQEEVNDFLKTIATNYKDNEAVNDVIKNIMKDQLQDTAFDIREEMQQNGNVSMQIPLNDDNYNKIKKVITQMITLGSESGNKEIEDYANKMASALDILKEKTLGSEHEEGINFLEITSDKDMKKVANEIETLGFILMPSGEYRESLSDHIQNMNRLNIATNTEAENSLNALNRFITSRKNKIKAITTKKVNGTTVHVPMDIGAILAFNDQTLKENYKLRNIVDKALNNPNLNESYRQKLSTMKDSIEETIKFGEQLENINKNSKNRIESDKQIYDLVFKQDPTLKNVKDSIKENLKLQAYAQIEKKYKDWVNKQKNINNNQNLSENQLNQTNSQNLLEKWKKDHQDLQEKWIKDIENLRLKGKDLLNSWENLSEKEQNIQLSNWISTLRNQQKIQEEEHQKLLKNWKTNPYLQKQWENKPDAWEKLENSHKQHWNNWINKRKDLGIELIEFLTGNKIKIEKQKNNKTSNNIQNTTVANVEQVYNQNLPEEQTNNQKLREEWNKAHQNLHEKWAKEDQELEKKWKKMLNSWSNLSKEVQDTQWKDWLDNYRKLKDNQKKEHETLLREWKNRQDLREQWKDIPDAWKKLEESHNQYQEKWINSDKNLKNKLMSFLKVNKDKKEKIKTSNTTDTTEVKTTQNQKPKPTKVAKDSLKAIKTKLREERDKVQKTLKKAKNEIVLDDGTVITRDEFRAFKKEGKLTKNIVLKLTKATESTTDKLKKASFKSLLIKTGNMTNIEKLKDEHEELKAALRYIHKNPLFYANNTEETLEKDRQAYEKVIREKLNIDSTTLSDTITTTEITVEQIVDNMDNTINELKEIAEFNEDDNDTPLEKELKVVQKLIEDHLAQIELLKSEKIALQQKIKNHKVEIAKYKEQIAKEQKRTIFKGAIPAIINAIKIFRDIVKKYISYITIDKKAINEINKKIFEHRMHIRRLEEHKEGLRAEYGISNGKDALIDKYKGTEVSLSYKLLENKDVMNMMPRIIKNSKEGKERVENAIRIFKEFSNGRANIFNQKKDKDLSDGKNILANFDIGNDFENNKVVAAALNMASLIMYSKINSLTNMNNEQLEDFVEKAFGKLYIAGMPDSERTRLVNIIRSGKIIPLPSFYEVAGKVFLNELGKKINKAKLSLTEQMGITNALGAMVMYNMLKTDNSYSNNGPVKKVAVIKDGIIQFEEPTSNLNDINKVISVLDFSGMDETTRKNYSKAGATFEFAMHKDIGTISLDPIVTKENSRTRNANVPKGKKAVEYLNKQQSMPWRFSEDALEIFKQYENNEGKIIGDSLEKFKKDVLGDLDEILKDTPTMKTESVIAKYRAEELQIERMIDVYHLVKDKEFYIPWDYTVSNRSMMDSTLINPQNHKISRFLVGANNMQVKIDFTKKHQAYFIKVAAAQALDLGIDKKPDTEVFKELDKLFTLTDEGKLTIHNEKIQKLANNPTLEGVNTYFETTGHKAPVSEKLHLLQLAQLLHKLQNRKDGEAITTQLAVEVDGITNGMSIVLMQMGYDNYTIANLAKTGVYVTKSGEKPLWENHGAYKADSNNKDMYETPIEPLVKNLLKIDPSMNKLAAIRVIVEGGKKSVNDYLNEMKDLNEEKILKDINKNSSAWRKFLKNPVMTYIYGASINNISKSTALSLIVGNSYMSVTLRENELEALKILSGKKELKEITYKIYDKDSGTYKDIKNNKDPKYIYINNQLLTNLVNDIDKNIHDAINKAFIESFNPVSEFRKTLKIIDQINYLIFKSRVAKEITQLGKTRISDLTPIELNKIYEKLQKEGTYYAADNPLGALQDYVQIEKVPGGLNENYRIIIKSGTKFQSSSSQGLSVNIQKQIQDLIANVGAIGVTTVHSIDGSIMVEGHFADVLNIYDALVLGVDPVVNIDQIINMNKYFYEINTRHSILGSAVQKLINNIKKAEELGIDFSYLGDIYGYEQIRNDFQRILAIQNVSELEMALNSKKLKEKLLEIHKARKVMNEYNTITNQYYVTDLVKGYKPKDKPSVKGVFTENKEEEEANIVAKTLDMVKEAMTIGKEALGKDKHRNYIVKLLINEINKKNTKIDDKIKNILIKKLDDFKNEEPC